MLKRRTRHRIRSLGRSAGRFQPVAVVVVVLIVQWLLWTYPADRREGVPSWLALTQQVRVPRWLEPKLVDMWFRVRGALPPPEGLVIVSIDDYSLQALNISRLQPWPREVHARLVNKLADYGARRVIFDLLFQEKLDEKNNQSLADAMRRIPTAIGRFDMLVAAPGKNSEPQVLSMDPLELFQKNADKVIFFGLPSDFDRSHRLFETRRGEAPWSVPLASAIFDPGTAGKDMPGPRDFINFYGPPGESIKVIPYFKALDDSDPQIPDVFRGAIVFVGQMLQLKPLTADRDSMVGNLDALPVPVSSERMFGVEIQANIVANLINQNWIRRAEERWERTWILVATILLSFLAVSLRPLRAGAALLMFFFCWAVASYQAFLHGYFLPGITLWIVVLSAYFFAVLYHYRKSRRALDYLETAAGIKH